MINFQKKMEEKLKHRKSKILILII